MKFIKRDLIFFVCMIIMLTIPLNIALASESELFDPGNSPVLKRILTTKKLRVGINPNYKPFSFIEGKERIGIDIDIAELLAHELGVELEMIVPKKFSDLIPMIRNGGIDIIIAEMTRNFERSLKIDFSDPYYETGLSVMMNKVQSGRDKIPIVNSYDDFISKLTESGQDKRLIISVTAGKSPARSVRVFFPKSKIIEYPTNETAAEAVLAGKAHIMIHDETFLKVWMNDNKEKTLYKMLVFPNTFKKDYYAFAIRKGNQDFLNMLNVFIMELRIEGFFERFMNKYMQ